MVWYIVYTFAQIQNQWQKKTIFSYSYDFQKIQNSNMVKYTCCTGSKPERN